MHFIQQTRNVADNDAVKKSVYDKLVNKDNATDTKIPSTRGLVTKTQYNSDRDDQKDLL